MKNYYLTLFSVIVLFTFMCATCGQKKTEETKTTTTDSPEVQRKKMLNEKFAKKWTIQKHYHPGAIDEGEAAPEGEFLDLKADGTYEMKIYNHKETGTWQIPTPRPKRYEAMGMNMPLQEDEELLELKPKATDVRQERSYLLKMEDKKLMLIATFDPTSLECVAE